MRFRLLRSKAFWFGVPGLVFLVWGWWHSMGHIALIDLSGQQSLGFGHFGGELVFARVEKGTFGRWSVAATNEEMTVETMRELKTFHQYDSELDPDLHMVFIPYPYVILAYMVVWSGVLGWRWRRYWKAGAEEVAS